MSDARRRLRLVTDAAYATEGAAARDLHGAHHLQHPGCSGGENPGDDARSPNDEDLPKDDRFGSDDALTRDVPRTREEAPTRDVPLTREEAPTRDVPLAREEARFSDDGWPVAQPTPPQPDAQPGHRWGTPALLAARLGVIVLLLAVAAVVTIIVTRPSAPAHQPDLAWPDPPQEWLDDGAGAPGEVTSPDGEALGAQPDQTSQDQDPSAAADHPQGSGAADGGADPESGELPAGTAQEAVVVHVAGQVHDPGIVELPGQARVHQALTAAGGPTPEADLAALNLAAPVADGQQIYVPAHGEEPRPPPASSPGGEKGGTGSSAAEGTSGEEGHAGTDSGAGVNINTADAATLQTLPGIGPAMAERILTHRDQHGPFAAVDDLVAVSGIGPATLTRLRDQVVV